MFLAGAFFFGIFLPKAALVINFEAQQFRAHLGCEIIDVKGELVFGEVSCGLWGQPPAQTRTERCHLQHELAGFRMAEEFRGDGHLMNATQCVLAFFPDRWP